MAVQTNGCYPLYLMLVRIDISLLTILLYKNFSCFARIYIIYFAATEIGFFFKTELKYIYKIKEIKNFQEVLLMAKKKELITEMKKINKEMKVWNSLVRFLGGVQIWSLIYFMMKFLMQI